MSAVCTQQKDTANNYTVHLTVTWFGLYFTTYLKSMTLTDFKTTSVSYSQDFILHQVDSMNSLVQAFETLKVLKLWLGSLVSTSTTNLCNCEFKLTLWVVRVLHSK